MASELRELNCQFHLSPINLRFQIPLINWYLTPIIFVGIVVAKAYASRLGFLTIRVCHD
jgi:hypothetical protein